MPDTHSLLLFLAAGLALNLTPGPDMLYVASRSASEGRAAGVASALGIGAGTLVHIALVAGGLAALLAAVPVAPTRQVIALGLLFDTSGTLVNLAVALGASGASDRLRRNSRAAHAMERAIGALFVGLGVRLAVAGRR